MTFRKAFLVSVPDISKVYRVIFGYVNETRGFNPVFYSTRVSRNALRGNNAARQENIEFRAHQFLRFC